MKSAVIAILLMATAGFWMISGGDPFSRPANSLALGSDYSGPGSIEIPLMTAIDLNSMNPEGIKKLRRDAAGLQASLLKGGRYEPFPFLFDSLEEGLPWVTIRDLYYTGPRDSGEAPATWKEAAASRLLLNPFMLIKAEFWGLSVWGPGNLKWNKQRYDESAIAAMGISPYPVEQRLVYYPGELRAELTYGIKNFLSQINMATSQPLQPKHADFALFMQNAIDFGYKFVALDSVYSRNVSCSGKADAVLPILDRFDVVVPAWNKEGRRYNHVSTADGGYDKITVSALPAAAVFKLWFEKPASAQDPANFLYYIYIE